MIADLHDFKHDYLVKDDKIGYKEQDGLSFGVVYGYKTMFAYFHEHEQKRISKSSLEENIFIGIKCGSFSYAEIPECFKFIMGVTGTLKTLSKSESNIVENVYGIMKKTFIPSVFGENKRTCLLRTKKTISLHCGRRSTMPWATPSSNERCWCFLRTKSASWTFMNRAI